MAHTFDLVVRGGTVADGTGSPLREADVAVDGGTVAAVGRVGGAGREEIDARGLLVTPGVVDVHTHYDGQATWDERLVPSTWHGVTTVVMGNCGVGFAPVRPEDRDRLIELMEGVEDIPGAALHEGLDWRWQSFPEYLDALERRRFDADVGAQLPHGALRLHVMSERGARLEPATRDDVAQMRRLAAEAMRAGALGFSTSRTLNHRTVKGDPTPSLRATEEELTGIALGLGDAGTGVIEMISDFDTPDEETEFALIRRIVAASGRPLSLSLAQAHGAPQGWRSLLARVGRAAADGLPIKAQVAPRPIGTLYGLQSSLHPFCMHPSYREIAREPLEQKLATLRDPAFRARLLVEAPDARSRRLVRMLTDFARMFPLGATPDYEPPREASLAAIAAREGRSPAEVCYDLLLDGDGRGFLFAPFSNYAELSLDACGEMMRDPHTVLGLGDGGAHVGLISDASFPTTLLAHWGRDRARGRIDLPTLVRKQCADTARAVGLLDRGVLVPGMKADVNVIDFDALAVEVPVMAFDLPAGGKRLLQRARGYRATIVSGEVVRRDGEETGARPGRLVRGAQPPPG
ncbi:MAG: amidohydrolase family protein [Thermodesulfobacteriota bacterium]